MLLVGTYDEAHNKQKLAKGKVNIDFFIYKSLAARDSRKVYTRCFKVPEYIQQLNLILGLGGGGLCGWGKYNIMKFKKHNVVNVY